jgi:hypothetical protein
VSAQEKDVTPAVVVPTDLSEITTAVANFDRVGAGLADLTTKFKGVVYDVATTEGLDAAKDARRIIRAPRFELERLRTAAKAPILALGRQIDGEAKRISEKLLALETPIDDQIKKREKEIEEAKAAKQRAEAARVEGLRRKIQRFMGAPVLVANQRSSIIRGELQDLQSIVGEEDEYQEFTEQARDARRIVIEQLTQLLTAQEAHETEQLRLKDEREKLEADRKRQEQEAAAERQRQAEAKAAQEAADRRRREEREAEEAEQRRKDEERAERIRKEDAERREQIEAEDRKRRERQEREDAELRAEQERLEAQRLELERWRAAPVVDEADSAAADDRPRLDVLIEKARFSPLTSEEKTELLALMREKASSRVMAYGLKLTPEDIAELTGDEPTVVNPATWPAPAPLPPTDGPLEPEPVDMPRPTNDQLVQAIADVFDVSDATARQWLMEFQTHAKESQ